ncbi:MAG: pilus assembly protein PilM [Nitrospinae bacterium]|nr:pilus assembly protein PilM [Nitrospinota bacterium]
MAAVNISKLQDGIKGYWDKIGIFHHVKEGIRFIEEKGRVIDRLYFAKSIGINISPELVSIVYLNNGFNGIQVVKTHSFPNSIAPQQGGTSAKDSEDRFLREADKFLNARDTDWDELIIGIPRSQVILKYISIPAPDERLIKKILDFEIERHIPLKTEDIYYDFQVLGRLDKNIFKVLIGAVKKDFIDYYLALLKKIRIEPTAADISSLSLYNFFSEMPGCSKGTFILLNIEGGEMDIDIIKDGMIGFSRGVRLDSQIKLVEGHILSDRANLERLGDFAAAELNTAVASFRRLEGDISIDRILLFGKAAALSEFDRHIGEKLNIKTSGYKIQETGDKKPSIFNLEFGVAIGLGLRGITKKQLNINLLPKHRRSRKKDHSIFVTLIMLFMVLILTPASVFSWIMKDMLVLSKLEKDLSEVKSKASVVEKMDMQSLELESRIKSFNKLKAGRISRLEIMRELADILPSDVWLSEVYITEEGLEMNGFAGAASNLIQIMENSPVFVNVRFDGTITKDSGREKFRIKAGIEGKTNN